MRDDTPGACAATPASRRDARFSAQNTDSGTPPGCNFLPRLTGGGWLCLKVDKANATRLPMLISSEDSQAGDWVGVVD